MDELRRELLLDSLNQLWRISKQSEDYWQEVALLEWEEGVCYFDCLARSPPHLQELFGQLNAIEIKAVTSGIAKLAQSQRAQTPGFFEIILWACVVEAKSPAFRQEIVKHAIALDTLSRKILGAASQIKEFEFSNYVVISEKFIRLAKHLHPAFAHSEGVLPTRHKAAA